MNLRLIQVRCSYERDVEDIRELGEHHKLVHRSAPKDWPEQVYTWIDNHDSSLLDDIDGMGIAYIEQAILDLGFYSYASNRS